MVVARENRARLAEIVQNKASAKPLLNITVV
jgi:hypothetical protein